MIKHRVLFSSCTIYLISIFPCLALTKTDSDTLIINPITFRTPSPKGWNAQYNTKVNFPIERFSWRKIWMEQTLKCDSMTNADEFDCGSWDYIWDTMIIIPKEDTTEIFKIGSFVTPYGKGIDLGGEKGWKWMYDITDYYPLLSGEVGLISGNNQELLDLKFIFIPGEPTREVLDVKNIFPPGSIKDYPMNDRYSSMYRYGALSADSVLKNTEILLRSDAQGFRIKAIISGHGHSGPDYCCEWTDKMHYYWINGQKKIQWSIWKDCGNNPIYPQGGTWPYDRAGWCPGSKVDEHSFEITDIAEPGSAISIDYKIEPVIDNRESLGFYLMSHQLFSFGPPNFKNNAEIEYVYNPNTSDNTSRMNPSLMGPKILVKNSGEKIIRNIKIIYGLVGNNISVYRWSGHLDFLEKETITLPIPSWEGISDNRQFMIKIESVNGRKDDNQLDSEYFTTVRVPQVLPNYFTVMLETNNLGRASENILIIRDIEEEVLFKLDSLEDSKIYTLPVSLNDGYYEMLFSDSNENGIDKLWWKSNQDSIGISGAIKILDKNNDKVIEFPPDFGQEIRFPFIIGEIP